MTETTPKTMSVPEAGRIYYGIGRDASYQAAKTGQIIVIEVHDLGLVCSWWMPCEVECEMELLWWCGHGLGGRLRLFCCTASTHQGAILTGVACPII